ncbi:MAG: hypothetical protein WAT78_14665 [Rhizobiaceae bacterium]
MSIGGLSKLLLAVFFNLIGVATCSAQDINTLIKEWNRLNLECRGGAGSAEATEAACQARSLQGKRLRDAGLCPGEYNLPFEAWDAATLVRERWLPCGYEDLVVVTSPWQFELENVRLYFEEREGVELLKAQLLLQTYGVYEGKADAVWGSKTEMAFESVINTYISVGGAGPDWGIRSPGETERLLGWLETAAHSNVTGSEFPD